MIRFGPRNLRWLPCWRPVATCLVLLSLTSTQVLGAIKKTVIPTKQDFLELEAQFIVELPSPIYLKLPKTKDSNTPFYIAVVGEAERVNDFETGSGLSYRSDPPAAESRRGHGQPADCLAATGRWPALRVLSLTTAPWKTLRVSHTSPQKAISSIMQQFPFSVG